MIVEVRASVARVLAVVRFLLLAFATLVIAHDAVYLQSYGPQAADALESLGHAGHRPFLVVAAASALCGLIVWGGLRIATLSRRLHRIRGRRRGDPLGSGGRRPDRPDLRYRRTLVRLWVLQALVVIPAFVVQENVESRAVEGIFPGLGVLIGDHAASLPTLLLVIGSVSAIGALFRWQIARHIVRLAALGLDDRRAFPAPSPPARAVTIAALLVRHRWLLARRTPGRAPPLLAA